MQAALCMLSLMLASHAGTPVAADHQAWGQAILTTCVLSILILTPLAALATSFLEPQLLKVALHHPPQLACAMLPQNPCAWQVCCAYENEHLCFLRTCRG